MVSIDDSCVQCDHHAENHEDGTGRCTVQKRGANPTPCTCRRYRSYAQKRAQQAEDRFWARVGR